MNIFSTQNLSLFLSVLLSGMVAGLLFGYSCSVNIGLGRLNDLEYLKAMQSINKAILNPAFFLIFFGALLVLPVTAWVNYTPSPSTGFYLLLSAAAIYFIGVFGVTIFGNIPLNNVLASFNIETASAQEILSHREQFESSWNKFHLLRTTASIITFALTILSIFKSNCPSE
jgi:uncharacterized membrane protein